MVGFGMRVHVCAHMCICTSAMGHKYKGWVTG